MHALLTIEVPFAKRTDPDQAELPDQGLLCYCMEI